MTERTYETPRGTIHYWIGGQPDGTKTLVFLPGLTADHRLFDKQMQALSQDYHVLVWDAPGHGASRPFELTFSLTDKADCLHGILEKEGIVRPVLVGQSMGGYVAQCFLERYPGEASGLISIDSAPLKRRYVTGAEIWLLKRCEWMYRIYPWGLLMDHGSKGCATSAYGRSLMREMMTSYSHPEYARLSGHGFRMLAEAMAADLPYAIDCPCLLICGEKDMAGSAKSYNRRWAKTEGLPLVYIAGAGHNANTDAPDTVNAMIDGFAKACR